jgi:hypothetical protein
VAAVLETKGNVTDGQLKEVRSAGYADNEITEILLTISLNYFTNIFNQVNQTKVDFPVVLPGKKSAFDFSKVRAHANWLTKMEAGIFANLHFPIQLSSQCGACYLGELAVARVFPVTELRGTIWEMFLSYC